MTLVIISMSWDIVCVCFECIVKNIKALRYVHRLCEKSTITGLSILQT